MPSRVLAVEHPTPSREEVISAEKQDVARKQRDRRMFGALLGTLKQFCREETQVKEKVVCFLEHCEASSIIVFFFFFLGRAAIEN